MAVFDKKVSKKVKLDDTEALTVTIENAQNINGHTEYVIKVQRGPSPDKSWVVCKRYSDFVTLHQVIHGSEVNILLPPKKLIGNMDRNFVAQRQLELQNYLTTVLTNPILASNLNVKKFLDPYNYAISLQELALQHVSMTLRSEVNLELVKPLPDIGWRLRKHYFLVKSKLQPKAEMLLQWVEFGPDKYLEEKELQNVFKYLKTLDHPHLEKIEYFQCGEGGCFTVRHLHSFGTLKDLIYGTKPKSPYIKKYGNPKQSKALSVNNISVYGRQIIETLLYLHERGIPFGHLHLGNILVVNNNIKLLDIENNILGLPSFYRPFIVQHKKLSSMESIDVYLLGHALFEMAFGYPLQEPVCDNISPTCPDSLGSVLKSILSTKSCKSGLPTLQELLQHPFFCASQDSFFPKINFKFPSTLKQSLKLALESTEKRLQEEQRLIRHIKKVAKMQMLLSSGYTTLERPPLKEDKSSNYKQSKKNFESLEQKSPRSDSLTSNSTAASVNTTTPPLSVSASKVPSSSSLNTSLATDNRTALLNSICSFDKSTLRRHPASVNGTGES